MYALVSPAKRLDLEPLESRLKYTQPTLLDPAFELVARAQKLSAKRLGTLMKLSPELAQLNAERFRAFERPFTRRNAKQAALTFAGDTYRGLQAQDFAEEDWAFAQKHLGILSGLYGLLRPLDLIQPYRLEMGTRLKTRAGASLYDFWGDQITKLVNRRTSRHADRTVINLASVEYFRAVDAAALKGPVITPVFKEVRGDQLKVISFLAKFARGAMARWIVQQQVQHPQDLKAFTEEGYSFDAGLSSEQEWVFVREPE